MDAKSFALGYNVCASQKGGSVSQAELEAAIRNVVPGWALKENPPEVDADPEGTAERKTSALRDEVNGKLADYDKSTAVNKKIGDHNVSAASHEDIRLELQRLADRLNAALNSDDTSLDDLKEIVAYIKSNKTLIDGITSSKVNVTDIVNNLTTNTANVPLSAAQGVVLKLLIDSLEEIVEGKVTADQVAAQIATALSNYPTASDMGEAISNATENLAPMSAIPTVPQTLPNPYALTILGKTYTGGKAVSLTAEEIMDAIKTASGGVVAYLDGNRLVLSGNLPDATYTAYYEIDGELIEIGDLTLGSITPDPVTYTVKWVNYDGTVLETDTVTEGETPAYNGATPTKPADSQYTYTFKGWDKTVVAAVADATYTAVYDKTAKPAEVTNLLPSATDASGNAYNGTKGWKTGYRLSSSSGNESASSGIEVTGFMPVKYGQTIKLENITTADGGTNCICFYNGSRTYITGGYLQTALDESKVEGGIVVNTDAFTNMTTAVEYFRFSATEITTDSVVTVTG